MLRVSDLPVDTVAGLLQRYGLSLELVPDDQAIAGSFWGEPEAGIVGNRVIVRADTPIHSLLHETSHVVCMTPERRSELKGDAGGDNLEECAVCFLQIALADEIPGAGKDRLMRDMDEWGYSFRLGSTRRWFDEDAEDVLDWLLTRHILAADGTPTFQLRQS